MARQDRGGFRPLQRQQCALGLVDQLGAGRQMGGDMRDVGMLGVGVHHDAKFACALGDHQIVEDAALGVRQHRVANAADSQRPDVARHQPFDRGHAVVADEAKLPHMGNVEQTGGGARMQMFGQDARHA